MKRESASQVVVVVADSPDDIGKKVLLTLASAAAHHFQHLGPKSVPKQVSEIAEEIRKVNESSLGSPTEFSSFFHEVLLVRLVLKLHETYFPSPPF